MGNGTRHGATADRRRIRTYWSSSATRGMPRCTGMEQMWRLRRVRSGSDAWLAAGLLLVCLTAVYYDVMFLGRSVIMSNLSNPLDPRPLQQNYGPAMVPPVEWSRRNLYPFPNLRDPAATWWQWEPRWKFFHRALQRREWPL